LTKLIILGLRKQEALVVVSGMEKSYKPRDTVRC